MHARPENRTSKETALGVTALRKSHSQKDLSKEFFYSAPFSIFPLSKPCCLYPLAAICTPILPGAAPSSQAGCKLKLVRGTLLADWMWKENRGKISLWWGKIPHGAWHPDRDNGLSEKVCVCVKNQKLPIRWTLLRFQCLKLLNRGIYCCQETSLQPQKMKMHWQNVMRLLRYASQLACVKVNDMNKICSRK